MVYLLTGDVRVSIQSEDRTYVSVYHTTTCRHTWNPAPRAGAIFGSSLVGVERSISEFPALYAIRQRHFFFMIGGDVNGSWKTAPAQLFTRIFLDAMSPGMFRHACTSRLTVNDKLYARPMDLFLVEHEAEAWLRTHHLLAVQTSMSADNLSQSYSGRRGYYTSKIPL